MVWLLKKLIKIIIFLTIVGLIVGLGVVFFLDPNDFRNQVNTALQDYTGQRLQVKGPIKWHLRPKAKLILQDIVLNEFVNEASTVLKIKEASIDFDGFSYFTKNLVITNLELNDVAVDWDLFQALKKGNPESKSIIKSLTIKNISILNSNQDKKYNWQLRNSTLTANNLAINANAEMTPIKIRGDLVNVSTEEVFNIDATLKANSKQHMLTLNPLKIIWNNTPIIGDASITQYENDIKITGSLSLDDTEIDSILKKLDPYYSNNQESKNINAKANYSYQVKEQILDLTNVDIKLTNGAINGNIKASLISPYQLEFALSADNIDFMPIYLLSNAFFPKSPNNDLISVDFAKNLTVNGKFTGSNLHFNHNLQIEQMNFSVVGQNGILQFNPITMNAYGTIHNITLNLDVINKDQPFFQLTEQADRVELEPWLNLIEQNQIISGNASIKASLEALGNNTDMLKQTVTGSVNMYIHDGILYDIDTTALMNFTTQAVSDIFNQISSTPNTDLRALAISKSGAWINSQQNNPNTKFEDFELKADIEQGISKKASIAMSSNAIELKATGGFNLLDNTLDFSGTLISKKEAPESAGFLAGYMKQTALPVLITGTIQKPIFGPNIQDYAVSIIALARKDLLNQAITKMVAVTPPNVKTSKTASDLFLDSLQSLSK